MMKHDENAARVYIDFIVDFFNKNFDKITYDLSDSGFSKKKSIFLKELDDVEHAIWAEQELVGWGMDEPDMLQSYRIFEKFDGEDCYYVLKIGDKLIKMTGIRRVGTVGVDWYITFTKRKLKTIKIETYI